MLRLRAVALLICTAGLVIAQYSPSGNDYSSTATLYDTTDCTGPSITLPGYVPNMAALGYDKRGSSARFRGFWISYELIDYNWAKEAVTGYVFQDVEACVPFINPSIYSSWKTAGFPDDYRKDSITFYTFTWFQGAEEMVAEDRPMLALDLRISSFIFTGTTAWTIYDQPNYMGNSLCLQTPNAFPSVVVDTTMLTPPIAHGSITSVRKGCFSMNTVTLGGNNTLHAVNNNMGPRNIPFD